MALTFIGLVKMRPGQLPTDSDLYRRGTRDDQIEDTLEVNLTSESIHLRSRARTCSMGKEATRSPRRCLATKLNGQVAVGQGHISVFIRTFDRSSLLECGADRTL